MIQYENNKRERKIEINMNNENVDKMFKVCQVVELFQIEKQMSTIGKLKNVKCIVLVT